MGRKVTCMNCSGSGKTKIYDKQLKRNIEVTCSACKGAGQVDLGHI